MGHVPAPIRPEARRPGDGDAGAQRPATPDRPAADPTTSELVDRVITWFAAHRRDLPWRAEDRTAWGVLVSEVMLQQTPVVRVLPVWLRWMAAWPTPADLAAASTSDVLRAWDRLGYPRRALRLQECARAVTERHAGVVPREEADLRTLPGVGSYTAAAVVAFAYGGRSVVLDTNVRRVLARTLSGHALPAPTQTAAEVAVAAAVVPERPAEAAAWAAASMELGAVVCTARTPRCGDCPVADLCRWRAAGYPDDLHAHRRRAQGWAGTDRQVRGRVMALLRESHAPVPLTEVEGVWADGAQLSRCVDGLVTDGLVELAGHDDDPVLRLPA